MNLATNNDTDFDLIVIGSGPAGQKAAIQAAKLGHSVAMIERDRYVGGACVHRGTIPSKTLRENALHLANFRANADLFSYSLRENLEMETLIERMDYVVKAHDEAINHKLNRNNIHYIHGRAMFLSPNRVNVSFVTGGEREYSAQYFVIATGSYPRQIKEIPIDHEHVFDSDSVLSMIYLPRSLIVLGSGVIASEYASIFSTLGVNVTMIDAESTPLGLFDEDISQKFVQAFNYSGGEFVGNSQVQSVEWNDVSSVVVTLNDGQEFMAEKLLCATGRVANVSGLGLNNIGLELTTEGLIAVDENYRTKVPNIFAAGDVVDSPALASVAMEEGRRAAAAAFGFDMGQVFREMPLAVYGIPELSSIGLTEKAVIQKFGKAVVGRALFEDTTRGQISGVQNGMLKMVADPSGEKLLGVQIIGEGATELIHIAQIGLTCGASINTFIDNVFNFPSLSEAYRHAALHIKGQLD